MWFPLLKLVFGFFFLFFQAYHPRRQGPWVMELYEVGLASSHLMQHEKLLEVGWENWRELAGHATNIGWAHEFCGWYQPHHLCVQTPNIYLFPSNFFLHVPRLLFLSLHHHLHMKETPFSLQRKLPANSGPDEEKVLGLSSSNFLFI